MTSYAEQAMHDPALRAFIQAEIARAGIAEQALRVELQHARQVIAELQDKLKAAQAEAGTGKKGKK